MASLTSAHFKDLNLGNGVPARSPSLSSNVLLTAPKSNRITIKVDVLTIIALDERFLLANRHIPGRLSAPVSLKSDDEQKLI